MTRSSSSICLLLGLLALVSLPLEAQQAVRDSAHAAAPQDTLETLSAPEPVVAEEPASAPEALSPKSAFLRSLAVPGWGQLYIGAPVRGVVYLSMELTSLYMIHYRHQQLKLAREDEAWERETGWLRPDEKHPDVVERKRQREDWIALAIATTFLAAGDAFVGAHLRNADIQVGVMPTLSGELQFRASIPVGRLR